MSSDPRTTKAAVVPRASAIALSDTIIVKVGVEEKKYTLHKKLLAFHSGFFRGALSGKFKETDDGIIHLRDVETDTFDVFVDWIYEKRLPPCVEVLGPHNGMTSLKYWVYVLADRLLVLDLKVALFDYIFAFYQGRVGVPKSWLATYFFENLSDTDPMLQLLVDSYCVYDGICRMDQASIDLVPQLPKDFLVRVLLKLHQLSKVANEEKMLRREDYNLEVTSDHMDGSEEYMCLADIQGGTGRRMGAHPSCTCSRCNE